MGKRVGNKLLEHNVFPFILCIIGTYLFWRIKYQSPLSINVLTLYNLIEKLSYVAIIALFIVNVFCVVYKNTTNRNWLADKIKYGRSYRELKNFFSDSDPHAMEIKELPTKHWSESTGIILGKLGEKLIEIPSLAQKNIAFFGIPKSGKTVTLISTCLQYSGSIFAIDIKGDIYNSTSKRRNIKVFSPADPENSMLYDPLRGIADKTTEERRRMLSSISMILLPDQLHSSDGQYFVKGGRSFFIGISLYLLERDLLVDLPDIVRSILNGSAKEFVEEIRKSDCTAAQAYTNSFFGENMKNVAGCYAALCEALRPFNSVALSTLLKGVNLEKNKCYITPQTLEDGYDVYLQIKQSELELYAPLLALITQQFINEFKSRTEGTLPPILMVLDEFPQLRKMDGISTALATLRSKNVTVLLAMQSIAQLDKWYGESGRKEIIDCCASLLFFKIQDTVTRKWASDFIGTKRVLKKSNSLTYRDACNRSTSYSESREAIFQPEDFGDLGKDKVLISDSGKYVLADIVKYYEDI